MRAGIKKSSKTKEKVKLDRPVKHEKFLTTIPFSGFYNSVHSDEIDHTFEQMFSDRDTGSVQAPECICDKARDAVSWSWVYRQYAKEYCESFLAWLSLDGVFESMSSPKFYNFETDRVFAELTRSDLARLWRGVSKADLDTACNARFTSRSGFASHYQPDWRTWGPLSTWDHNQIGTLLECFAETERGGDFGPMEELDLMKHARCNGAVDGWIWENAEPALARMANLWDWIQEREKRPVKTMAQWLDALRAQNRPFTGTPLGGWIGGAA